MGNEEEWQGDESITILIVAGPTAPPPFPVGSPPPPLFPGELAHAALLLHTEFWPTGAL